MNRELGEAVLARRLELGYATQQDAARAAGVGTTTWGLLEGGKQVPKTKRLRLAITRALQWPDDALDDPNVAPPPSPTEGLLGPDQPVTRRYFDEAIEKVRSEIAAVRSSSRRPGRSNH